MEMAHNPGDKCGRGLRNEEVPPSTVTVPVLRAYLGRLVDIHVALIYSVPYYTVYTHTHTHTLGWLSSSEKRGFVTMEGGGSRVGQ